MLDIYVVSLSSAWISDSVLMGLMGRVPKGAILLLEDLDAAFTRSFRDRDRDGMSDLNTLSLSGLLNALDGVAAAEGRILFATTNHLEKLDPALSRPGRMDVWVEFKNASKWQAEALFRNFFPSTDEDDLPLDDDIDLPGTPTDSLRSGSGSSRSASTSSLWSASTLTSSSGSAASAIGSPGGKKAPAARKEKEQLPPLTLPQFGSSNKAYLPPPIAPEIVAAQHSARPLDGKTLANLAKRFADSIPEGEFSVAALQGYLLKNKSRPEAASSEAAAWVVAEREMRERMRKEKEAKESREKAEREKKRKAAADKKEAEAAKAKKEKEDAEKASAGTTAAAPTPVAPALADTPTPAPTTTEAAPTTTTDTATAPGPAATVDASGEPAAPAPVAKATPVVPTAETTPAPEAVVPEPLTTVVVPSESDSESSESEYDDDVDRSRPMRRVSPWAPARPAHSQWPSHPPPATSSWSANSWL
ncbi:hypothetical protein K438DRAFT_1861539 [Mycena galopus ATCC 62051]|nr:hypothetical protein K438DRAFT_1861539 [Mycena galopus ATCC 62051]